MADFSTSVGNFKGVMLCNRPTTVQEATRPQASYREPTGISTTVQKQRPGGAFVSTVANVSLTGVNPIRKAFPASKAPKLKSDDVTWRHKRWLADFQQKRALLMEEVARKAKEKNERNTRVVQRAAKRRAEIRELPWDLTEDPASHLTTSSKPSSNKPSSSPAPRPAAAPVVQAQVAQPPSPPQTAFSETQMIDNNVNVTDTVRNITASKKPASGRPAWAYTEEGHKDAEEEEVEDLLDFAQNLDFDSFIEDMEVREAVKFVKKRVEDLKHAEETAAQRAERKAELDERIQRRIDEAAQRREEEGDDIAQRRSKLNTATSVTDRPDWDPSTRVVDGVTVKLTADELRAHDAEQQERSGEAPKVEQENRAPSVTSTIVMPKQIPVVMAPVTYAPPKIVVSMPNDTIARKSTVNADGTVTKQAVRPSNLPFLYRHPAI